jgi:hypothetical protein
MAGSTRTNQQYPNARRESRDTTPVPDCSAVPYLGRPFLVGFEGTRAKDGIYSIDGDGKVAALEEKKFASKLFQHPERQVGPGKDQPR